MPQKQIKKKRPNPKKYIRPSWDEYFMKLVEIVGTRSTCDRGRPGCVIVKDRKILTTGYAGSPVGLPHCDEVGHEFQKAIDEDGKLSEHCVRTIHAEVNAICQAAKNGIQIDGATIYIKFTPCYTCAKMLVNAGIKRVVAQVKYHRGDKSIKLFKAAKVKFELMSDAEEKYEGM